MKHVFFLFGGWRFFLSIRSCHFSVPLRQFPCKWWNGQRKGEAIVKPFAWCAMRSALTGWYVSNLNPNLPYEMTSWPADGQVSILSFPERLWKINGPEGWKTRLAWGGIRARNPWIAWTRRPASRSTATPRVHRFGTECRFSNFSCLCSLGKTKRLNITAVGNGRNDSTKLDSWQARGGGGSKLL